MYMFSKINYLDIFTRDDQFLKTFKFGWAISRHILKVDKVDHTF